jgi:uncharacterized protein (DUF1778 family)
MKRSLHKEKEDGGPAPQACRVRFTPGEKQKLQKAAKISGKGLSAFVAEAGLRAARRRLSAETAARQP